MEKELNAAIKSLALTYIVMIMKDNGYEIHDHELNAERGYIRFNIKNNVYLEVILYDNKESLENNEIFSIECYYVLGDKYKEFYFGTINPIYNQLPQCIEIELLPAIYVAKNYSLN